MATPRSMCAALFETKPFHDLRMRWLIEIWDTVHQRWNDDMIIGLMLDGGFSHRQIEKMRQAFSLTFNADVDRYFHEIFLHLERADRRLYVRTLEPVRARASWANKFRAVKGELKIEMNPDGTISSLRLIDVVPDMLQKHRALGMMDAEIGVTGGKVKLVLMFDGFPVDDVSIVHFCVFNASLKPELCTQSESLLRVLTVARISENNAQLWRAAEHHHLGEDFNGYARDGKCALPPPDSPPPQVPAAEPAAVQHLEIDMFLAADKKGVEVFRGCAPCCPWCTCSDSLRLKLPWPLDRPPVVWRPSDWRGTGPCPEHAAAEPLLRKICKHPLPSLPLIYEWAHTRLCRASSCPAIAVSASAFPSRLLLSMKRFRKTGSNGGQIRLAQGETVFRMTALPMEKSTSRSTP